jgi:hypothetical protein
MLIRGLLLSMLMMLTRQANAGDISGAPAILPPETLGDFSSLWSNNFISSGHEPDEYRTQQLGLQFDFSSRWGLVFDYSILTVGQSNPVLQDFAGRIDEISLSFMYEFYRNQSYSNSLGIIQAGAGLRAYGDFDGGYMQNGLHRLINNGVDDYPYVDTETKMAIFWLKGDYQKLYPLSWGGEIKNFWQFGYWLGGTGLVSTDRQWDASLAANAVMRNKSMTLWLGVREDWRENYELDFVQQATALSESGTSLAIGVGVGPLIFESVHGFGDKFSYSRLILTSVENEYTSVGYSSRINNAVALNFLLPDVELELQYRRLLRYQTKSFGRPITWLVLDMHYGEPTYQESFDVYHPFNQLWPIYNVYSEVQQVAVGVEFEWHNQPYFQGLWPYLTLLAGRRSEQLKANSGAYGSTLEGQESEKASSSVLEAGAGIRINLYSQQKWQFLYQVGVVGNYPLSSKTVNLGGNYLEVLQPNLTVNMGFSLNFDF